MRLSQQEKIERRTLAAAIFIIENKSTVRATAKHIGVSKSTVHKDLKKRLPEINRALYLQVEDILAINSEERYMRGGLATRKVYERKMSETQ